MDEKTKEALGEALKMLVESLQGGKDFVVEQAPFVVQEIITFGRAKHTIVMCIAVACLLSLLAISRWAVPWIAREFKKDYDSPPAIITSIACGLYSIFVAVVAPITIGDNFSPMLEAWFAPRLYVIHQIKDML